MSGKKSLGRQGALTYLIGAVLLSIGIVFGHGDEKHDSTEADQIEQTDSLTASKSAALNSVYASVDSGFAILNPVFKKGCFDCHTTRTVYPWYYKLPIVKGMIDDDIADAKKHMDMSNGFPFGGHGKPADDLVAIRQELLEGKMPPLSYRIMHWSAKPSESERDSVIAWVERGLASLASFGVFPTESENPQADAALSTVFACPIHPEIVSDHETNCTLCGKPLEEVNPESLSDFTGE